MDAEVKQRNRRRKRAQRMQAQRDMTKNVDSNEEDESPIRAKPPRPPNRRKKSKEPLCEEDIIDGFAILGFKTYDDLETVLKLANKENVRRLVEIERPKHEPRPLITHHISAHPTHGITLTTTQDPATSDDSGRASERLTGSSMAPRDADSSRDRLSDASSRCSSGKGYICDSEGDDDKGSDASSVIFGATPGSRKHEFPGALPPSLPSLHHGTSTSPVPAPTPPDDLPPPTPAPAQLPPPPPPRHVIIEEKRPPPVETMTVTPTSVPSPIPACTILPPPPVTSLSLPVSLSVPLPPPPAATLVSTASVAPMSVPQPAAAAPVVHHPPAIVIESTTPGFAPVASVTNHARTDSPAVATSAPGYHPPYQPLYAPYAASGTVHTPYTTASVPSLSSTPTPVTAITATTSSHPTPTSRSSSPRGHSPTRERESYSSGVSSLSRNSVTPLSCPPPPPINATTTVSSSLASKPWTSGVPPQLSPAPRPTPPPLHNAPFAPPMFTAPLPPPTRASPSVAAPPTNPNPFSAENLFQSSNSQADMLRRELDNRFLASQDSRGMNVAPPPYLRTEMHQHQHHHTHVHQHTTSLLPPPPTSNLFPAPMFKEIPKLGSHESPFYRQNIGLPTNYPGYTPGLLHPGLTGPTPFVPPSHLPAFQPKPSTAEQSNKPKITKSGKWNAMHVRVAWEIYHHQHKGDKGGPGTLKGELLRPPTHLFNPSVARQQHELPSFPPAISHRPPPPTFEQQPHPGSLFTSPASHSLGSTISPFTRYGAPGPGAYGANTPFSPFPPSAAGRPNELPQLLHDPWRRAYPPSMPPNMPPNPWSLKPDPMLEQREREERERLRREREERERREREEKQRRIEQQQQAEQRERERREKERREMERREMEQRERERERLLHQQRLAESKPLPSVIRDRSPVMRNGDMADIRIKEEPRSKEEEHANQMMRETNQMMRDANNMMRDASMMRGAPDPRYHPYLRHHSMQPSPLSRVLPPPGSMHHYAPPQAAHWPPPPTDYYRYDALRYNPLVDAAMRAEEERVKMFGSYGHPHPSQLRTKDPGLMHLRPGPGPPVPQHKLCATPPTDIHKKEEPR